MFVTSNGQNQKGFRKRGGDAPLFFVVQAPSLLSALIRNPKSAMGFGLEGFLGVEGRFFYTVVFKPVASTASLAFFYREEMSSLRFSGFRTDHALRPSRAVPLSVGFKWKTPTPDISPGPPQKSRTPMPTPSEAPARRAAPPFPPPGITPNESSEPDAAATSPTTPAA